MRSIRKGFAAATGLRGLQHRFGGFEIGAGLFGRDARRDAPLLRPRCRPRERHQRQPRLMGENNVLLPYPRMPLLIAQGAAGALSGGGKQLARSPRRLGCSQSSW